MLIPLHSSFSNFLFHYLPAEHTFYLTQNPRPHHLFIPAQAHGSYRLASI